ncbi:MAG: alpha/beta hydrolase-fold protein [Polyangiales bacterium]
MRVASLILLAGCAQQAAPQVPYSALVRSEPCPAAPVETRDGTRIVACSPPPQAGARDPETLALPLGAEVPEARCPAPRLDSGATAPPEARATDDSNDCLADGLIVGGEPVRCPRPSDARVRDLAVHSRALGLEVNARVLLPRADLAMPEGGWPVLYLLTGHSSTYQAWSCATNVQAYLADLPLIAVLPDATFAYDENDSYYPDKLSWGLTLPSNGMPSWYSDWLQPAVTYRDGTTFAMKARTFHLDELRELLVENFGANGDAMVVAGMSMGGYGALHYAADPSRPFVAAAALSAFADTELWAPELLPQLGLISAPTLARGSIQVVQLERGASSFSGDELWGPTGSASWRANNPRRLAAAGALSDLPLYVSAGQGSSRDELAPIARQLDGTLDIEEAAAFLTVQSTLRALEPSPEALTSEFFPRGRHDWVLADIALCRALQRTLLPALDLAVPDSLRCLDLLAPAD